MVNDEIAPVFQPDAFASRSAPQERAEQHTGTATNLQQLSFQYMQAAVWILDLNGVHVEVNPELSRMTGFSAEELVGMHPENSYWPPEACGQLRATLDHEWCDAMAQVETTLVHKSGQRFPVILQPFVIRDHYGKLEYYAATVTDITRQQATLSASLQESEMRFHALFENAGDGIVILEGENAVDCNERALEIYGITREKLLCLSDFSLAPAQQPNGQSSRAYIADKIDLCLAGKPQTFPWSGIRLDGTTIETEVTLTTFMHEGKLCTQSIIRDITERKRMEDSLKFSEVRLRTLFENAGDAISIMKDFQIIECNQQLLELYNFSGDAVRASPTFDFFPATQPCGTDSHTFFRNKVKAARAGKPQYYEWYGRSQAGREVITEVTLTSFTVGGEIFEQAISRDITQRKQMEATLLDLNRTLENRVAQRTEELERACAELLQRNSQFRTLTRKLTQAEDDERRRIARLLHDNHQQLLAAAKFKAETLLCGLDATEIEEVGQNILDIIDQALEVTRALTMELAPPVLYGQGFVTAIEWLGKWMEDNHQLKVQVNGTLPLTPIAPNMSNLMFRATRELLFNVIKHSGVKNARVDIVLSAQALQLEVVDEGLGFDVSDVLHSRTYGLLSIQEQLVSLNGRLDMSSKPGLGTTARLTVPMSAPRSDYPRSLAPSDSVAQHSTATPPRTPGPLRILIADDHALSREALSKIIMMVPEFEVAGEAVDGLDAIEQARKLQPDIILMDVSMPRLDGLQATQQIAREFPGIRIIGVSMFAMDDMQARMIAAGASGYLHKLNREDELISAIHQTMNAPHLGQPPSGSTTEH